MKKKLIKIGPYIAIIAFVVAVWPWQDKGATSSDPQTSASVDKASPGGKQAASAFQARKLKPSNFKAEVVEAVEAEKKQEKQYKITSLAAIAYAANNTLALTQGPGETPAITEEQIKESAQLRGAIEATKNFKKYGSRLSALVKAAPFDKQKFQNDKAYREEYLSTAEVTRVYQVDDKSEFAIKRTSAYYQEVLQGESVFINVEAEPNMPVSITSFDLGKFANHLTHQTVLADTSGQASFEFFGVPGTFNDSNLLVSSPTSRLQLKFVVHTKIKTENKH